jgi:hypothetical protein
MSSTATTRRHFSFCPAIRIRCRRFASHRPSRCCAGLRRRPVGHGVRRGERDASDERGTRRRAR